MIKVIAVMTTGFILSFLCLGNGLYIMSSKSAVPSYRLRRRECFIAATQAALRSAKICKKSTRQSLDSKRVQAKRVVSTFVKQRVSPLADFILHPIMTLPDHFSRGRRMVTQMTSSPRLRPPRLS